MVEVDLEREVVVGVGGVFVMKKGREEQFSGHVVETA